MEQLGSFPASSSSNIVDDTIWLDRVVILRGMKKQIKSFKSAFRGFCFAVKSESHMRFHLVATFYVFVFGCFYNFFAAKWRYCSLLLCALYNCTLMGQHLC